MSATIEELKTCSNQQEFEAAGEAAKKWFTEVLSNGWTETTKGEVTIYDKPSVNNHHFIKTVTQSKLKAEDIFNKVKSADFATSHKYDKELVESEVLETINEHLKVTKQVNSAPWPVAAREFVSVLIDYEENGSFYTVSTSINYPKCDTVGKKYVRGVKLFGMKFTPNDEGCLIERVLEVDPRGSVIAMAVNASKKEDANRLLNMKKFFEQN
uniref:START domain-containing protein n=1 Tax=Entamoeba histolytica TaxID=5759 RepID=S0AUR0_ENTHI|nr:hypothetical protein [Entamoeba histolytica]